MKALLLGMILSTPAAAAVANGAVSGGGGHVVICPGADGAARTVQLLDLWEAKAIFNQTATLATGNLTADVSTALLALENSYNNRYQSTINGVEVDGQDYLLDYMQIRAQMFLSASNPDVTRLHGVTLDLTQDADELGTPTGCTQGQVVVYDPNDHIYIDQDLFDQLSESDQAALIVHEAFYSWLRKYSGEANSLRTRRAVGSVFAGNVFSLNLPTVPTGAIVCQSNDVTTLVQNKVYLWQNGTNPTTGAPIYSVYFDQIGGTPLIGLTKSTFNLNVQTGPGVFLSNGEKCTAGVVRQSTYGFQPTGPVEFDRALSLRFYCNNGTLTTSVLNTPPGAQAPIETPVTCQF